MATYRPRYICPAKDHYVHSAVRSADCRGPSPQEITGEVFACDMQRVVLLQPGSKQPLRNLRLLKTEHIKVRTAVGEWCQDAVSSHILIRHCMQAVTSRSPPSSDNSMRLPHVDMSKAREREARAVQVRNSSCEECSRMHTAPQNQPLTISIARRRLTWR